MTLCYILRKKTNHNSKYFKNIGNGSDEDFSSELFDKEFFMPNDRIHRIVLLHPCNHSEAPWIRSNECPPTGLLVLAQAIRNNINNGTIPAYEVEVANSVSLPEAQKLIQGAKIVGVTSIYSNHENCLKILKLAKQQGAQTWIGGVNASILAFPILLNHAYVDLVFLGDAGHAVIKILQHGQPKKTDNVAYRTSDGMLFRNPTATVEPELLFNLDSLHQLDLVDRRAPFNLSSIRGCIKAVQKQRCSFCSLQHQQIRLIKPSLFWQQVAILREYGFHSFEESGDCFFVGRYPQKLLQQRPPNLADVQFKCYARPEQITQKNIRTLKELNVTQVFLGVESLDDNVLRQANRGCTINQIFTATRRLAVNNIGIHFPIIWGLPGTTVETLARNLSYTRFVRYLFSSFKTRLEFLSSLAVPIAGSALFKQLAQHPRIQEFYPDPLKDTDQIDYQRLFEAQTALFTSVSMDNIQEHMRKMKAIHQRVGGFGV